MKPHSPEKPPSSNIMNSEAIPTNHVFNRYLVPLPKHRTINNNTQDSKIINGNSRNNTLSRNNSFNNNNNPNKYNYSLPEISFEHLQIESSKKSKMLTKLTNFKNKTLERRLSFTAADVNDRYTGYSLPAKSKTISRRISRSNSTREVAVLNNRDACLELSQAEINGLNFYLGCQNGQLLREG